MLSQRLQAWSHCGGACINLPPPLSRQAVESRWGADFVNGTGALLNRHMQTLICLIKHLP